jgi:hypothetical protein
MKRNIPRVNNPARLARIREQAVKLRERVKRSNLAFLERNQARFTWWQRTFRAPMVANWAIFANAKTLLSAFMALLGLASGKRSSLVALMVAGPSPRASRQSRRLHVEGLEQRQLMAADFSEFLDPNPASGNQFGHTVVPLRGGNVVITSPFDDAGGTDAGAVYLFNGKTGALISTLTGAKENDQLGFGGVTTLSNGNYVVISPSWDNGDVVEAGAVTFGSGTIGVSGVVSSSNSLVGTLANDYVGGRQGRGVVALDNGNYVVISEFWDNGDVEDAGAVTFGNGTNGISGVISDTNSLVGSNYGDMNAAGVTALSNGNYVVLSPEWKNGDLPAAGAVTFGNGTTGVFGVVSSSNSLVGTSFKDNVGSRGVVALNNGNYVVISDSWSNGDVEDVGAVTFGNGTSGVSGVVSSSNSLVGTSANDNVGGRGVVALNNSSYVVLSPSWDNGDVVEAGAVTFGNGTTGVSGVVSSSNSLVGTSASDNVGGRGVVALNNSNFVVISPSWNNGSLEDAGAVTFGNGMTGVRGVVSAANSLVGDKKDDKVGLDGVTALSNGNYVVGSRQWDNGTFVNAGAATFGNGTNGTFGVVSSANSLVGSSLDEAVGNQVKALSNGNYVIIGVHWDNGAKEDAGAVTFGNGTTGVTGVVTSSNSLVGTSANDYVGGRGVVALNNGNYVVISESWDNGEVLDVGAVTLGSGATGVFGEVSDTNSLVGTKAYDYVGVGGVTALSNGNFVVTSPWWANGDLAYAGAVTFGNGTTGVFGKVSETNSLVGTKAFLQMGNEGVTALTNGNYVVRIPNWDDGVLSYAGAVTFGDGTTGVSGAVSAANSAIGGGVFTDLKDIVVDDANSHFFGRFLEENGGKVRLGSQVDGFAPKAAQNFVYHAPLLTPWDLKVYTENATLFVANYQTNEVLASIPVSQIDKLVDIKTGGMVYIESVLSTDGDSVSVAASEIIVSGTISTVSNSAPKDRGNLTLIARNKSNEIVSGGTGFSPVFAEERSAKITLTNADLDVGAVEIKAEGQSGARWDDVGGIGEKIADSLLSKLQAIPQIGLSVLFPLSGQAKVHRAKANITLENATIKSSGNVAIEADAFADASINAISLGGANLTESPVSISIAFSHSFSEATINLNGSSKIDAPSGNIKISTNAESKSKVDAKSDANTGIQTGIEAAFNLALTMTQENSTILIGPGTEVNGSGSVDIKSNAKVKNESAASTNLFQDGTGALTVALGFDDANVKTEVFGTVTSRDKSTQDGFEIAAVQVLPDTRRIELKNVPPSQVVHEGDRLRFESDAVAGAYGLVPGETYIVESLTNTEPFSNGTIDQSFRLRRGEIVALDARQVSEGSKHSLRKIDLAYFKTSDVTALEDKSGIVKLTDLPDGVTIVTYRGPKFEESNSSNESDEVLVGIEGLIQDQDYQIVPATGGGYHLRYVTKLKKPIDNQSTTTTVAVQDISIFPQLNATDSTKDLFPFNILIGGEEMRVVSRSGRDLTVVRAVNGTTTADHAMDAFVSTASNVQFKVPTVQPGTDQPLTVEQTKQIHAFAYTKNIQTFEPSKENVVDPKANTILLPANHGFKTGDFVIYETDDTKKVEKTVHYYDVDGKQQDSLGKVSLPDAPIDGLGDYHGYRVIVDPSNPNLIRLSSLIQMEKLVGSATPTYQTIADSVVLNRIVIGGNHRLVPISLVQGITISSSLEAENTSDAGSTMSDEEQPASELASNALSGRLDSIAVGGMKWIDSLRKGATANGVAGAADKAKTSSGSGASFDVAGSFALNLFNHNVTTTIGSSARLVSDSDLTVDGKIEQKTQLKASAEATRNGVGKSDGTVTAATTPPANPPAGDEKGDEIEIAAAVAVGVYSNVLKVTVTDGAKMNAADDLQVNANVEYPLLSRFVDAINPLKALEENGLAGFEDILDGSGGVGQMFNVSVATLAGTASAKLALGGGIAVTYVTNEVTAEIGKEVLINQPETPLLIADDTQTVTVTAELTAKVIEVGQQSSFNLNIDGAAGVGEKLFSKEFATALSDLVVPLGVSGKSAIGGVMVLSIVDNDVKAKIHDNAKVAAKDHVGVDAKNAYSNISVVQTGTASTDFGFTAAIAVGVFDLTTTASIDETVTITTGELAVNAVDESDRIAIVGGFLKGKQVGIGTSVGVNVVDQQVEAFIGSSNPAAPVSNKISASEEVNVTATTKGEIFALVMAGALQGNLSKDKPAATAQSATSPNAVKPNTAKSQASILGPVALTIPVAVNIITSDVKAYIDRQNFVTESVTVEALTETSVLQVVVGASFAVQREQVAPPVPAGKMTLGGAGAVALAMVTQNSSAFIQNSQITATGTDSITVKATDKSESDIYAGGIGVAGNFAAGGKAAISFGASVAINDIDGATKAFISDSQISAYGAVNVNAIGDSKIFTLSMAGGVSANSSAQSSGAFAGGGTISLNDIEKTLEASILSNTILNVNAEAPIVISATDQSKIISIAGAAGIAVTASTSKAITGAIGIALSINDINNTISAKLDKTSVTTQGDLTIDANAKNAEIKSVAVAASVGVSKATGVSVSLAGAGAGSLNDIGNTVSATMTASTAVLQGTGPLNVLASDSSKIESYAVGASVSVATGETGVAVSVGASLGLNEIQNKVQAVIEGAGNAQKTVLDSRAVTRLKASSNGTIDAVAAAASVAVGAGGKTGVAVSGAGAASKNVILSKTNAFIDHTTLDGTGMVDIDAESKSKINATIVAASVAVGVGNTAGVGASVGVAVARNFIGWQTAGNTSVNTTDTALAKILKGTTVKVLGGVYGGDVYEFIGKDPVVVFDYTSDDGSKIVKENTRVKVGPAVYLFKGTSGSRNLSVSSQTYETSADWELIGESDLSGQDFGNRDLWKLVLRDNLEDAATVQAYVKNSTINVTGAVTLDAVSNQAINAIVIAASVAIASSSKVGVAFSGAGVGTENYIGTHVKAFVDTSTVSAKDLLMNAHDTATIKADAGAASVAGSSGGKVGVSVAIGVALAFNEISNEVAAYIANSANVTTTGNIVLKASSHGGPAEAHNYTSTQDGQTALKLGDRVKVEDGHTAGGKTGRIYSYRGFADFLSSDKTIADDESTKVKPGHIVKTVGASPVFYKFVGTVEQGAAIKDLSGQNYSSNPQWELYKLDLSKIDFTDTSRWELADASILARTGAASIGASFGGTAGVAVSGAGAFAQNVINTKTNATIQNSTITATGEVKLDSVSDASISAIVGAVSAAVGVGGKAGVGVSIGAAIALNTIGSDQDGSVATSQVLAYVDQSKIDAAQSLTLSAMGKQNIDAIVLAGSVAAAKGGVAGIGVSAAGAVAINKIGSHIAAYLNGPSSSLTNVYQTVIDARSISLSAHDMSTISTVAGAASIAAALGGKAGVAVSVGVAVASNEIQNKVEAYINRSDVATLTGDISLNAKTGGAINAISAAAAVSVGVGVKAGVAVSGAGAAAKNVILSKTNAYIDGSKLNTSGKVDIDALSESKIDAVIVAASVAVGVGGAAGVGASVGVAVARNFIGWQPAGNTYDSTIKTTDESHATIAKGTKVKVLRGVYDGDVYEFIGKDPIAVYDYTSEQGSQPVKANTRVKVGTAVYRFKGVDGSRDLSVSSQNYETSADWELIVKDPIVVYDYTSDQGSQPVKENTLVKVGPAVYRFKGTSGSRDLSVSSQNYENNTNDWELIGESDLSGQDFGKRDLWKLVLPATINDAATIQAYIRNSRIIATGAVTLDAVSNQTIDAVVFAGSVAIAASSKVGVAFSGAGVGTENRIRTLVKAYVDNGSSTVSAKDLLINAHDTATINADAGAASVAGSAGGKVGVSVAFGVALAFNEISNEVAAYIANSSNVTTTGNIVLNAHSRGGSPEPHDYTSTTKGPNDLKLGDRVKVETGHTAGGKPGRIYSYRGFADRGFADFLSSDKNIADDPKTEDIDEAVKLVVKPEDIVKIVGASPVFYKFIGTLEQGTAVTDLSGQNYLDTSLWQSYEPDLSKIDFSDTTRWELADASIYARTGAASIAASFGGTAGVAVSGAGAFAQNVINTKTKAYIQRSTIKATGEVKLDSVSDASISAIVGAVSAAVGVGGKAGVGVSIGAAIALNNIGSAQTDGNFTSEVLAYVDDQSKIDAAQSLTLSAKGNQNIDAVVLAGSVAAAGGGAAGVGVSAAGAVAINKIGSHIAAYIDNNNVVGAIKASSISLSAQDTSTISTVAGAASIAAALGGVAGVAVSVGVATASNEIHDRVEAYISNSDVITSTGDINLDAKSSGAINAISAAASVSIGVGGKAGVAVSGAGALSKNEINNQTLSNIFDSFLSIAGNLKVAAEDTATIDGLIISASVAVGGGIVGVGVALGLSSVENIIPATALTQAMISGGQFKVGGSVTVNASSTGELNSDVNAVSIGFAVGAGAVAAAVAGVNASHDLSGKVEAQIEGSSNKENSAVSGVTVNAFNTIKSDLNVKSASVAAAIGAGAAISLGVSSATTTLQPIVSSTIRGGKLKSANGDIAVTAKNNVTVTNDAATASVAASYGGSAIAGGGALATVTAKPQVNAMVQDSDLIGKNIKVSADSADTIDADSKAAAIAISIGGFGLGAAGSISKVTLEPVLKSEVVMSKVDSDGTLEIRTKFTPLATAESAGLAVSTGAAVGASRSDVTIGGSLVSRLDSSGKPIDRLDFIGKPINVGALTIHAENNAAPANGSSAKATGASGGLLLGANGAIAYNTNTTKSTAEIADNKASNQLSSAITVTGKTDIRVNSATSQTAEAGSLAVGLLSSGNTLTEAKSDNETTSRIGKNVILTTGNLDLQTISVDNNTSTAKLGSFGGIGVALSKGDTTTRSITKAIIDDGAKLTVTGKLDADANHTSKYNAKLLSLSGGLISGSGGAVNNNIDSTVNVNIGSRSVVTAGRMNATATNKIEKTDPGIADNVEAVDNVDAVAGGLIAGVGMIHDTTLKLNTTTTIGENAKIDLKADDTVSSKFEAVQNIQIKDRVKFKAGGLAAGGALITKIISTDHNIGVTVGGGVQIDAKTPIHFAANEHADVTIQANSDAYGAATATGNKATIDLKPIKSVTIGSFAKVFSTKDVALLAGMTSNPENPKNDVYKITSNVDAFAGSLIPLDNIDSDAHLLQTNTIVVTQGAEVKSGGDILLYADGDDVQRVSAQAKSVNWMNAIQTGVTSVVNLLTGDTEGGVGQFAGESSTKADATVTVNGTLETGIGKDKTLVIKEINEPAQPDPNKPNDYQVVLSTNFGLSDSDLVKTNRKVNSPDGDAFLYAKNQLLIHEASSQLKQFYEAEVTRLRAKLTAEGWLKLTPSGIEVVSEIETSFLVIPDITASSGAIRIFADILADRPDVMRRMKAPSDPSITITNKTYAYLTTSKLSIPDHNGGIFFNDKLTTERTTTPTILVENEAIVSEDTGRPWPGINVAKQIDNPSGNVTLKNRSDGAGSIEISASINAATQTIEAGRAGTLSINLAGADSIFEAGGSAYTKILPFTNGGKGAGPVDNPTAASNALNTPTGEALRGARVILKAAFINLNGLIESGRTDYTLVITADMHNEAGGLEKKTGLHELKKDKNPYVTVFFDTDKDEYVVGDIVPVGGYVEIHGHLANTGGGKIQVASGYASVKIESQVGQNHPIRLQNIDLSNRADGRLVINDSYQPNEPTIYESHGDYLYKSGERHELTSTHSYQPKQGLRYGFTIVEEKLLQTTEYHGTSAGLFSIDFLSADPETLKSVETRTVGEPKIAPSGAYFYIDVTNQENFSHNAQTTNRANPIRVSPINQITVDSFGWGLFGSDTTWQAITRQGETVNHTHSIKADRPIAINFTGLKEPKLDINWTIGRVTIDGIVGDDRGVTNIKNTGLVLTTDRGLIQGRQITLTANQFGTPASPGTAATPGTPAKPVRTDLADRVAFDYLSDEPVKPGSPPRTTYNGQRVLVAANHTAGGLAGTVYVYRGAQPLTKTLSEVDYNEVDSTKARLWQPVINDSRMDITATGHNNTNIHEVSGDLVINRIETTGNTWLRAAGGIKSAVEGALIQTDVGKSQGVPSVLNLVADTGDIGTTEMPVQIRTPWKVSFSAKTPGDAFLLSQRQLFVNQIQAGGDVSISFAPGFSMADSNFIDIRDERAIDDLTKNVWKDLQLTKDTGFDAKLASRIAALEATKTSEYRDYWDLRESEPESFQSDRVTLSTAEKTERTKALREQGKAAGLSGRLLNQYVRDALKNIEDQRNAWHTAWRATLAFNPNYEYTATEAEKKEIEDSMHLWTEEQLKNLRDPSFVASFLTNTDTELVIEQPNIIGKTVRIASYGVGTYDHGQTIVLKDAAGKPSVLNLDQRAAVVAAESGDLIFTTKAPVEVAISVQDNYKLTLNGYTKNQDAPYGDSSSTWGALGFQVGQAIMLAGDPASTTDRGVFYKVKSISADGKILEVDSVMTDGSAARPVHSRLIGTADSFKEGLYFVAPVITDPAKYNEATHLHVLRREDVDIQSGGRIDIFASSHIFIGSERDMVLGRMRGNFDGDNTGTTIHIQIKANGDLIRSGIDEITSSLPYIAANVVLLESANGKIGTKDQRLKIANHDEAILRAKGDINAESSDNSPLRVKNVFSRTGDAALNFPGGFVDLCSADVAIRANKINLATDNSLGDITGVSCPFTIEGVTNDWLFATLTYRRQSPFYTSGNGTGLLATIVVDADGKPKVTRVNDNGNGYKVNDTVQFLDPEGSALFMLKVVTAAELELETVPEIINNWQATATPTKLFPETTSGNGTGLVATIQVGVDGKPKVTITSSGSGYKVNDTVEFVDPTEKGTAFTLKFTKASELVLEKVVNEGTTINAFGRNISLKSMGDLTVGKKAVPKAGGEGETTPEIEGLFATGNLRLESLGSVSVLGTMSAGGEMFVSAMGQLIAVPESQVLSNGPVTLALHSLPGSTTPSKFDFLGELKAPTTVIQGSDGPDDIRFAPAASSSGEVQMSLDTDDSMDYGTHWTAGRPTVKDSQFFHVLHSGAQKLRVNNKVRDTNPILPMDVTADGSIGPLDVLVVINLLNSFSRPDWLASDGPMSSEELDSFGYFDVNADNSVDPLDVLTIINFLNRLNASGEGEFVSNPGVAITSFTQPQVNAGAVQFVYDKDKLHNRRDNGLLMEGSVEKQDDLASLDVALADWGSGDWASVLVDQGAIKDDDEDDLKGEDGLDVLFRRIGDKAKR